MSSENPPPSQHSDAAPGHGDGQENPDLTEFVQRLLGDMQQKFQQMSEQIIGRHILFKCSQFLFIVLMSRSGSVVFYRVDELEKNIQDLMVQVDTRDDGNAKK
ncbi:hypothetical protein EMCRGX_G031143 [Ephydatia muelleri]